MIQLRISIFLLFSILFGFHLVFAQTNTIVFEHLTTNDGLSHNSVKSFYQDKEGFMWIGTFNGLDRYDGIQFKKYRFTPKRYNQFVSTILEDTLGNFWFGRVPLKGNPESDTYQSFYSFSNNELLRLNILNDLTFGPDNKVYIAIKNSIYNKDIYDQDTVFFKVQKPDYQPTYELINCIKFDSAKRLWMGTDQGFFIMNPTDTTVSFFNSIVYPDLKFVQDFLFDFKGNLWATFTNQIITYNFSDNKFAKYVLPVKGNTVLTDIYQTKNGRIWVGTYEQGLFYLDEETRQFKCLLEQTSVSKIFEDRSNRLWIGTENAGVYVYDSLRNYFKQLPLYLGDKPTLMFHCDRVAKHGEKGLWIGSRSFGLLYYDFKTQKTSFIDSTNNQIDVIYEDETGKVWYNHLNYLVCYNPKKKTIEKIKHPVPNQIPIINRGNTLTEIVPFNHQLIICSDYGQVYSFNPMNKTFSLIYENKEHNIRAMLVMDDKLLLCVYSLGVLVLDESYHTTDTIYHNNKELGLIYHAVMAIHKDRFDTLWIGGYGGLSKFNPQTKEFENKFAFTESANYITSISEDEAGNLWIGSSVGIYKFDRVEQKFSLFDENHGVPTGRFFAKSAAKTKDGIMYFGGNNGIVQFDPNQVKINSTPPPLVFTDFIIHSRSGNDTKNHIQPLYMNINCLKNIHLKYKENSFTIKYAALNFTSPKHNQYKYKLEGLDEDWNFVGNQSQATYTNLNGGKYVFYVSGSNNDGVWNNTPRTLTIVIDTPPLKSWWAITLYFIFIIGIISTIYYYNLRKLRLQHQLEIKNQETESLQEINTAKSRFFTNISHEFRTPLSLILDPANRMIQDETTPKNQKKLINLIINNAQRLLFLINQILDLSKLKNGQLSMNAEPVNFKSFIKPICHAFSSRAEALNLEYRIILPDDEIILWIDRKKIENTLINLISNAFKFCPQGKITVEVTEEKDKVLVKIQDTGIGIPPDQANKVFNEYYQVNNSYQQNLAGTGIGLALVKEYLNLHQATIEVQSEENQGTTFTIAFLKGNSHFHPEEISPQNSEYKSGIISTESHLSPSFIAERCHPETNKEKSTVLLIEDNIEITSYLTDALTGKYRVISAENGLQGFEMTLHHHPDVVVCDVMMPVMDGYAYCEKVKQDDRTSHIPVILLTAKTEHEDKMKGLHLGADDYLGKPFKLDELELRVKYHIDRTNKIRTQFLTDFKLKSENEFIHSLEDQFLQKTLTCIEENYREDQFGVEKLSELMAMSRNHLYRKIKTMTNQTPNELIRNFRLRKASYLLSENSANVTEVCFEVGFNNLSYFSKCFFEFYGKHPSGFNKN